MVTLPCTHEVEMSCAKESDIVAGACMWPQCNQPAHVPYVYPVCKHEKKLVCHMLQDYNQNPSKVSASTIHAFCIFLIANFAMRYGIRTHGKHTRESLPTLDLMQVKACDEKVAYHPECGHIRFVDVCVYLPCIHYFGSPVCT